MRVAVTGAAGFVAGFLIPRLLARGDHVIALLRPSRDAGPLERAGVEVRRADLEDPATLGAAFAGADRVVHLAGMALTPVFLPFVREAGVAAGVFVSSAGVYTKLESRSAEAKRVGERTLEASGLPFTILRPSMIYGAPGDRNMARMLRWIQRWPLVPLPGGGRTLQQPVHVEDLAIVIERALAHAGPGGRAYDVGGPEAMTLAQVVRICARALGRPAMVLPLPLWPAHAAVSFARRLGLPTPVRPEQLLRLTESKAVDIRDAVTDWGFHPRSFAEGIANEVAMLRALR